MTYKRLTLMLVIFITGALYFLFAAFFASVYWVVANWAFLGDDAGKRAIGEIISILRGLGVA